MPATTNNSTTAATVTQGFLAVSDPAVPQSLAGIPTLVEAVELVPARSRAAANTGRIWIGPQPGDGTQLRLLEPVDQPYVITAPPGKKVDLSALFIDVATTGDGVIWTAIN